MYDAEQINQQKQSKKKEMTEFSDKDIKIVIIIVHLTEEG